MGLVSSHGDPMVAVTEHGRTVVVHRAPYCLVSRFAELGAVGVRRVRADFRQALHSPATVRGTWRSLRAGTGPDGRLANFDRGLA
jgi:hypothetical protein